MNNLFERLPSIIILVYAAILTSTITNEWQYSPYDDGGQVAFTIWFLVWLVSIKTDVKPLIVLTLASGLSLVVGVAADLNIVVHVALLIATLQFIPRGPYCLAHLAGGIAWLPALGYAIAMVGIHEEHAAIVRISLALLTVIPVIYFTATQRLAIRYG